MTLNISRRTNTAPAVLHARHTIGGRNRTTCSPHSLHSQRTVDLLSKMDHGFHRLVCMVGGLDLSDGQSLMTPWAPRKGVTAPRLPVRRRPDGQ